MTLFPIFVKLEGRPVLLVGAGPVGESKVGGLLSAGAVVTVVAPEATPGIQKLAEEGKISGISGVSIRAISTASHSLSRQCPKRSRVHIRRGADPRRPRQLRRRSRQLRFLLSGRRQSRRPADRHLDRGTQPGARAAHSHRARTAVRPGIRAVDSAAGRRAARAVRDGYGSGAEEAEAARDGGGAAASEPTDTGAWSISSAQGRAIRNC